MKKRLPIIIIAVLVVVFAGLGFYSHQKSKIKYNTSYVNGNTAGNLYNAGLFCEKNGTVYFANPDDDYRLYSMDTNGNHLKKLSYDRVMYINADDHYVYYVRNNENNGTGFDFFSYARNSLCRIDQNGENTKILDKDPCLYASRVNDNYSNAGFDTGYTDYIKVNKDTPYDLFNGIAYGDEKKAKDARPGFFLTPAVFQDSL